MGLYHFRLPKSQSISFEQVFLVQNTDRRSNLATASRIRESAIATLNEKSKNAVVLQRFQEYLPYILALSRQILKTSNLNMSTKLFFRWTSSTGRDPDLRHNMVIFHHELIQTYNVIALVHYRLAEETLEAGMVLDGNERKESPEKYAAHHLKIAASIFQYLGTVLIPSIPVRNERRPTESYAWCSNLLAQLCLVNVQEILVRSATEKATSPQLISKLCVGISEVYQELLTSASGLREASDRLELEFEQYCSIKATVYQALSHRFVSNCCAKDGKYGLGIRHLEESLVLFENALTKIPLESNHPSLTKLRLFTKQNQASVHSELKTARKDNDSIYFDTNSSGQALVLPSGKISSLSVAYTPPDSSELSFFV